MIFMIRLLKVLREFFYVLVSEFPKCKAFLNKEEHQNDLKSLPSKTTPKMKISRVSPQTFPRFPGYFP